MMLGMAHGSVGFGNRTDDRPDIDSSPGAVVHDGPDFRLHRDRASKRDVTCFAVGQGNDPYRWPGSMRSIAEAGRRRGFSGARGCPAIRDLPVMDRRFRNSRRRYVASASDAELHCSPRPRNAA